MIPFDRATHCCTVHYTNCYFAYSLLCRAVKCPQMFVNKGRSHTRHAPSEWLNCWPFPDRKPLSLLIVIRNVAETCLYKAMNLELCWLPATCFFFLALRWRQHSPPIRRLTFTGPPGFVSQKVELFKFRVVHSVNMFVLYRFRHGTPRTVCDTAHVT